MTATALIQTRIDPALKERASQVLEQMGLSLSDAVRLLLTRVANDGALPFTLTADPDAHDRWFRAQVLKALDDPGPLTPHEQVEPRFAVRRAEALRKAAETAS